MYLEVELENKEKIEFWGVRSWDYTGDNLWIYFLVPFRDGIKPGFIKNAKVISAFVDESDLILEKVLVENNPEYLALLK